MKVAVRFILVALTCFRLHSQAPLQPGMRAQAPVSWQDVLESVERHYPPLLAALQDRTIAEGELVTAQGAFDLTLRSLLDNNALGYYEYRRADFWIEQPLSWQGLQLFSGWRVSDGLYPSYYGHLETRSLGEVRSGLRLPLGRDRAIDARRANLRKSLLGRRIADLGVEQQRLFIILSAARRYWDWVAAGLRYRVAEGALKIAEQREELLEQAVRAGQLPAIEVEDNRRAILQRRALLTEALRAHQAAAIELSLFYRDAAGSPVMLTLDHLPALIPEPKELTDEQVQLDLAQAVQRRPELDRLAAQRHQLNIDKELADNQLLPAIDLSASFISDHGSGMVRRGPQEFRTTLQFELPWQRRAAKGRQLAADARLRQLDWRERYQIEQIAAEVRDAASAVQTAAERAAVLKREVEVTRNLEDLERTRFELGEGTLFFLNQREQATIEAEFRAIAALADYQRSVAAYDWAIARWR